MRCPPKKNRFTPLFDNGAMDRLVGWGEGGEGTCIYCKLFSGLSDVMDDMMIPQSRRDSSNPRKRRRHASLQERGHHSWPRYWTSE